MNRTWAGRRQSAPYRDDCVRALSQGGRRVSGNRNFSTTVYEVGDDAPVLDPSANRPRPLGCRAAELSELANISLSESRQTDDGCAS